MKLLVLSFYFSPDLSAGSFRCNALIEKLREKGIEIELITTLPNRYSGFSTHAESLEQFKGFTIHRIPLPEHKSGMFDQAKAFLSFYKGARKLTRDKSYDAVFSTSSRLFTAFLGARIAEAKRLPLYLDIRDIFLDTLNDVLSPKVTLVMLPLLNRVEKYTFKRAKRINLVSKGFRDYFETRYPEVQYRYYTNGIDPEFIEAAPSQKTLLNQSDKLKVVYAGNIGEGQGLDKIVPELATDLKDEITFTIIGAGGRLKELSSKTQSLGNVSLKPPVKRSELIAEYKQADILFLHLNDYEAFKKVLPSKIFEYAALGKPVWAGVSGYAAEFLGENVDNCAVFSPGDKDEAISLLSNLTLVEEPRTGFIKQFARRQIMTLMAEDIADFMNEDRDD